MAKKKTALAASTPSVDSIVNAVTSAPKEEQETEGTTRINVAVPKSLHKAFKRKAFDNDETHQEILLRAIRAYAEG